MIVPGFPTLVMPKSYADFYAHITSLGYTSKIGSDAAVGSYSGTSFIVSSIAESGDMYGSPWGSYYSGVFNRVIQHSLPSYSVFASIVSNGAVIATNITTDGTTAALGSVNRNSYTSIADAGDPEVSECNWIRYWDFAAGEAKYIEPINASSPVPYVF